MNALLLLLLLQEPASVPWTNSFWIWPTHAGQARPWRVDPRLSDRFTEAGYPDDIQVAFTNPDSARGGQHEIMWVTVIAYDPASDRFLGLVLNQPHALPGVVQFDNATFRWDQTNHWPVAIGENGKYGESGWPRGALADPLRSALIRGIRAYRSGGYGHNMPGIELCIATLDSLNNAPWPAQTPDERFLLHFVLGRCLAEKYANTRAVRQFEQALQAAPDSVDPYMSLLAEYSVLAHTPQKDLPEGTEASWERLFTDQVALVRKKFPDDKEIMGLLELVFDGHAADTSTLTREQMARNRRVGWFVLRWKRR